jgi:hypothetical protein
MNYKKRKLSVFFRRIKIILVLSMVSTFGVVKSQTVAEPNFLENDRTILGVDSNNNGVRDDVENFLYDSTYGDPELFKAWLQSARVKFEILKFYPDISKMKLLETKRHDALRCISLFKKKVKPTLNHSNLSDRVFNTNERKKIIKWWTENYDSFRTVFLLKDFKREEVCEF